MSSAQKTPIAVSLNNFTDQKISAHQQILGQVYPCSVLSVDPINSIVTVNFEIDTGGLFTFPQVTCPIIGSKYIRIPIQEGDKGICISANTKIGNISGLGEGLPSLTAPSNLGALIFVPIGNANWSATDLNSIVITSPNGTAIATIGNDQVKLTYGTNTITINSTGIIINGNVSVTGTITNNGVNIGSTHQHSGVQSGGNNTGAPI